MYSTEQNLLSMLERYKLQIENPLKAKSFLTDALEILPVGDSYEILVCFGGPTITYLTSHGILIGRWGSTKIALFAYPLEIRHALDELGYTD